MRKIIHFTKVRQIMLTISLILIAGSLFYTFAVKKGFNYGIDFSSGVQMQIKIDNGGKDLTETDLRDKLAALDLSKVVRTGDEGSKTFSLTKIAEEGSSQKIIEKTILDTLHAEYGEDSIEVLANEFISPAMSGKLASSTILYTSIALFLILVYIWVRFKFNYAISAIAAIFHDVLFLLGFLGVFQIEFNTAIIAAILTIIGYSLNDTIVIFDRIRENSNILKENSFKEIINISITQSLSRTIITSITTLIAVLSIFIVVRYLVGVTSITDFALSLIVGIVVGTYSSIFIASSLVLSWHNNQEKNAQTKIDVLEPKKDIKSATPVKKNKIPSIIQSSEDIARATEEKKKAKAKKKKKKRA